MPHAGLKIRSLIRFFPASDLPPPLLSLPPNVPPTRVVVVVFRSLGTLKIHGPLFRNID